MLPPCFSGLPATTARFDITVFPHRLIPGGTFRPQAESGAICCPEMRFWGIGMVVEPDPSTNSPETWQSAQDFYYEL